MQTFISSFNFEQNFRQLDSKRLFKQVVEAEQILNVLTGFSEGWKNHPAVKQWRGFEGKLFEYLLFCWRECELRGIAKNSENYPRKLMKFGNLNLKNDFPFWWNDERVSSSHRSRLLFKGEVDITCEAIKKHLKIKSIDAWLKENYKTTKSAVSILTLIELKDMILKNNLKLKDNFYSQFSWVESIDKPYYWPTKE